MKREALVALFLLLLISLSLGNLYAIHRWNTQMCSLVEQCRQDAEANNFQASQEHWDQAFSLWQQRQPYARLVLPHAEIDNVRDGFYQLRELLLEESPAAALEASLLYQRLRDMEDMESLKPGTIFCTIYQ